jgi:hypothetical protein
VTIRRVFRGASYDIEIVNPLGVSKGVRRLSADGAPVTDTTLPPAPAGSVVAVRVELG